MKVRENDVHDREKSGKKFSGFRYEPCLCATYYVACNLSAIVWKPPSHVSSRFCLGTFASRLSVDGKKFSFIQHYFVVDQKNLSYILGGTTVVLFEDL